MKNLTDVINLENIFSVRVGDDPENDVDNSLDAMTEQSSSDTDDLIAITFEVV